MFYSATNFWSHGSELNRKIFQLSLELLSNLSRINYASLNLESQSNLNQVGYVVSGRIYSIRSDMDP